MTYPPNFTPRSKPVTYTWLSWLLKLVVPVMVLPPLIWAGNAYLNLQEAPSDAEFYFNLVDEELVEIGKAKHPYIFEDGDNFEPPPPELNPSAQAEILYINHASADSSTRASQAFAEFEQWCYVSVRNNVPVFGDKTRGFLIDTEDFGFYDPEFGLANYSSAEYKRRLADAECDPEPVKSQYNTIISLTQLGLALAIGFAAAFAAYSFDHDNRNPMLEYGVIIFLAMIGLGLSMSVIYAVPMVLALPIEGYLFWKRDVL